MGAKWDNQGPRGPSKWIDLIRPASGQEVEVIAVSPRVDGVWLHWIDGHTVACTGEDAGCPYHHGARETGLRWKGYFAAVRHIGGPIVYAEVTEEAWRTAPTLRELSDDEALRGLCVTLSRRRGGPRRPVVVALMRGLQPVKGSERLPAPPDVRAAVSVLWESVRPPKSAEHNGKGEQ